MAENWEDLRIAEQRVNELLYLWESETEEPWSQEWRACFGISDQELD